MSISLPCLSPPSLPSPPWVSVKRHIINKDELNWITERLADAPAHFRVSASFGVLHMPLSAKTNLPRTRLERQFVFIVNVLIKRAGRLGNIALYIFKISMRGDKSLKLHTCIVRPVEWSPGEGSITDRLTHMITCHLIPLWISVISPRIIPPHHLCHFPTLQDRHSKKDIKEKMSHDFTVSSNVLLCRTPVRTVSSGELQT